MAGYFISSWDSAAFKRLTTSPTDKDAIVLASQVSEIIEESDVWPRDVDALADAIKIQLAKNDWYGDLSDEDAEVWDSIVFWLCSDEVAELGLDSKTTGYGSIYWDCAEEAAANGVEMMKEQLFGSSGFRYFGPRQSRYGYHRMYSILDQHEVKKLFSQLQSVESHFASLPDDGDGCVREQFFEMLIPTVKYAAENDRCIFIQTDT